MTRSPPPPSNARWSAMKREREREKCDQNAFSLCLAFSPLLAAHLFIVLACHFAYQDTIPWAMKIITLQSVSRSHSTNTHSHFFSLEPLTPDPRVQCLARFINTFSSLLFSFLLSSRIYWCFSLLINYLASSWAIFHLLALQHVN